MPKILVTGGCGYIGSHTVVDLIEKGYDVISLDNFYNSKPEVADQIMRITGRPFENAAIDLKNGPSVIDFLSRHKDVFCIIHFAAYKSVEESTRKPLEYHENNVTGLINLLKAASQFGIRKFIFSSSCTVYGQPDVIPVTEDSPIREAESPYGRTKQICEFILQDMAKYNLMDVILLRYFNPAGAHDSGYIGEDANQVATNLVPVITEAAIGLRDKVTVFGDTYDTRDGSCIRDYIHVMDLAEAHTMAMEYLLNEFKGNLDIFNLGYGEGVTVLEAIHAFEKATGVELNYEIGPPRNGDVEKIYANNEKVSRVLGWHPSRDIEDIMRTAWHWEQVRQSLS